MAVNSLPQNTGSFIPNSFVWDVAQLQQIDVTSPEFKQLLIRLYQNLNLMALSLNTRDAGYYTQQEFVNGQVWFPNPALNSSTTQQPALRQVFRKVFNFGSLPNSGLKTMLHEIGPNSSYTFTRIYGTASDTTGLNYIPLPYASPVLANNIELSVDATTIRVTTGSNRTNFNICYIVVEYLKF